MKSVTIWLSLCLVSIGGCGDTKDVQSFALTTVRLSGDIDKFYDHVATSHLRMEVDLSVQNQISASTILSQSEVFRRDVLQKRLALKALAGYANALSQVASGEVPQTLAQLKASVAPNTPLAETVQGISTAIINADRSIILEDRIRSADLFVTHLLITIQSDIDLQIQRSRVQRVLRRTTALGWYSHAVRDQAAQILTAELLAEDEDVILDRLYPRLQAAVQKCLLAEQQLVAPVPNNHSIAEFAKYNLD